MTRRNLSLLAAAFLALSASPARGGELAVEGQGGYFGVAFSRSANALFGSSGGATGGGAVRFSFWRGVFVSAGARSFSKSGERVFVASPTGPVQKLGFPLSVRISPIFFNVGYRLRQGHTLVPYAGVGLSVSRYRETSEVAGESFDRTFSKSGFQGLAGIEVGRGTIRFGAEVSYCTTPSSIGVGGVSKVYGEDDIGGVTVVGKVVAAFGR
jgi:hypothetical protein